MPWLGAHMSIAGGFYKAVDAAHGLGLECLQIFTHSPSQWVVRSAESSAGPPKASASKNKAQGKRSAARSQSENAARSALASGEVPPLADPLSGAAAHWESAAHWQAAPLAAAEISRFRETLAASGLRHTLSHNSYLINLAAPDELLWEKSCAAMIVEIEYAARLGVPYVVAHPGAYTTSSEAVGLQKIVAALDLIDACTKGSPVKVLLETTAGQGTTLGWRFEQLATVLAGVRSPERLGVCVDTCHIFAAGYPLGAAEEYRRTMQALDGTVGLSQVKAFHLNDSKRELGSRVDRHEHIGEGQLGLAPFERILNDPRFADLPMYLETEKGQRDGQDLDAMNLATLRRLIH